MTSILARLSVIKRMGGAISLRLFLSAAVARFAVRRVRIDDGLGRPARRGLHVWRGAPLWTGRRCAARSGRERASPALRLELALVVRQHRAPSTPRRVVRLSIFSLRLGHSHGAKAERGKSNAHTRTSHRISPTYRTRRAKAPFPASERIRQTASPLAAGSS